MVSIHTKECYDTVIITIQIHRFSFKEFKSNTMIKQYSISLLYIFALFIAIVSFKYSSHFIEIATKKVRKYQQKDYYHEHL